MRELLAKISTETHQKYVHDKHRQAFIHAKLNVALYGTLKAAILFLKKVSKRLKTHGQQNDKRVTMHLCLAC